MYVIWRIKLTSLTEHIHVCYLKNYSWYQFSKLFNDNKPQINTQLNHFFCDFFFFFLFLFFIYRAPNPTQFVFSFTSIGETPRYFTVWNTRSKKQITVLEIDSQASCFCSHLKSRTFEICKASEMHLTNHLIGKHDEKRTPVGEVLSILLFGFYRIEHEHRLFFGESSCCFSVTKHIKYKPFVLGLSFFFSIYPMYKVFSNIESLVHLY